MSAHIEHHPAMITIAPALQQRMDRRHRRAVALGQFRNSHVDYFGWQDWLHYMRETGKSLDWLLAHARYSDPRGSHGEMLDRALDNADNEMLTHVYHYL